MIKPIIAILCVSALLTGCGKDKEIITAPSSDAAIDKHALGTTSKDTNYLEFLRVKKKLGVDDSLIPSDNLTADEIETLESFESSLKQEVELFGDFPVGHIVEVDQVHCIYEGCVSNASVASYLTWLDDTHKTAVKFKTQMHGVSEETKSALLAMPKLIKLEDKDINAKNEHVSYIINRGASFNADDSLAKSEMKSFLDAVNVSTKKGGFAESLSSEIKAFVGKCINLMDTNPSDAQKSKIKELLNS